VSLLVEQAVEIAKEQLSTALPRRWKHVQAVGSKAAQVARILSASDAEALVAAAWLHDIGYAPGIADTGLHALDGGRWLRTHGIDARVGALVAHHSCALFEAEERGLADVLRSEFDQEHSPTADALWYSDMTTGPDGDAVEVRARLAEIRERYGPDHLVTRFWVRAEPTLLGAVERTLTRLADQPM
jgi:hypothetical protein